MFVPPAKFLILFWAGASAECRVRVAHASVVHHSCHDQPGHVASSITIERDVAPQTSGKEYEYQKNFFPIPLPGITRSIGISHTL